MNHCFSFFNHFDQFFFVSLNYLIFLVLLKFYFEKVKGMALTQNQKGYLAVLGGFFLHLVLGSFYLWGAINLYVASYYKQNFEPDLKFETTLMVFPFMSIASHTTAPFSVKVCSYLGMRLHCGLFSILIFVFVFLSSYTTSFTYFVLLYAIGFGLSSGMIYLIPLYNAYKYFPKNRGLVSGIIMGAYGLGTLISNNIFLLVLNPNNVATKKLDDGNHYFPLEICDLLPKGIRILAIYFAVLLTIGTALLFDYEDEELLNLPENQDLDLVMELSNKEGAAGLDDSFDFKKKKKAKQSSPLYFGGEKAETGLDKALLPTRRPNAKSEIVSAARKKRFFGSNIVRWTKKTMLGTDEKSCETVKEAFFSRVFWDILLMLTCSSMFGYFVAANYKNYGIVNIPDDRFLTLLGSLGALFNGSGRLLWGVILDRSNFKSVYTVLATLMALNAFTMYFVQENRGLYMIWVCSALLLEGGHFVLFPTLAIKVKFCFIYLFKFICF